MNPAAPPATTPEPAALTKRNYEAKKSHASGLVATLWHAILPERALRPEMTPSGGFLHAGKTGEAAVSEPEGQRPPDAASPAITPLGYVDHSDYAEKGVKLAYGELPDATLIKVDLLEPDPPPLICPICRTSVHKVRSKTGRLFFRHMSEAPGCGGPETNAHIWAKAQLLEAKEVWLPAVLSKFPQVNATLQDAKTFKFVDVLIEPPRGDLRPDLVVVVTDGRGETRELWIEIHVTHKCGPAKRAKIEARPQAAIEINLSAFRTSHDAAAIREALLYGADNRVWLYHKAMDEDFKARTEAIERAKAQAQARLRAKAQRLVAAHRAARVAPLSPGLTTIVSKLKDLGLLEVVGLAGPRAGFTVSQTAWQAVIWNALVVARQEADRGDAPFNAAVALKALGDCVVAPLRDPLSVEVITAAREIDPGFVAPEEAITRYFEALTQRGELWIGRSGDWHVRHERSTAVYRRIEHFRRVRDRLKRVNTRLDALFAQLPEPPAFDHGAWLDRPCLGERTPRQMIEGRQELWESFDSALQAIERMTLGWSIAHQLLGLPIEPLKAQAEAKVLQAKADAARRKAEAEAQEALDRRESLEAEAHRRLDAQADAWLDEVAPGAAASHRQVAFQSAAGLEWARNALWARLRDIAAEAERQNRWTRNLAELGRQASRFYDEVRRKVWINGPHPKLGGASPRDAVKEDAGLKASLALLPRKPQRPGY